MPSRRVISRSRRVRPDNCKCDDRTPAVFRFRDDLRLADNPALYTAARNKRPVVALYVFKQEKR